VPNRRSFCRALGGLPLFSLAGAPAFAAAEPSDADAALRASIESTRRSAAERARDADRHPYETLHFFGLEPVKGAASAAYSIFFLVFWLVISTAGAITHLLEGPGPGPWR